MDRYPDGRCLPRRALSRTDRRRSQRLNHLLFHTVTGPEVELLRSFIVLVDHAATSSGELDSVANDGAEHSLKIESGTDCLTDFSERFQFSDRSRQLTRTFFELLK